MVVDADIKGQVAWRKELEPGNEGGLDAEIGIWLRLDEAADGPQYFVLAESVQIALDRSAAFEWKGGDHALEPGIALRLLDDPSSFVEILTFIDIDLDKNKLIDAYGRRRRGQVFGQDEPFQLRRACCPGIAEPLRVAEMDVAIDDREF
jgi:hypothetical protein